MTFVRIAAFAALAGWAAVAWGSLVAPAAPVPLLAAVGLAVAGVPAVRAAAGRSRRGARWALWGTIAGVQVLGVLLLAGVPARLLLPDAWGELVGGLSQGLAAVPTLMVPYEGADEWVRSVVLTGGGLLALSAGWLAFRPGALRRRGGIPVAAATVVGVLYTVAVIQQGPRVPFLAGAVFAALLTVFLYAERIKPAQGPTAAVVGAVAIVLAMLVAPRLDAAQPLVDYEQIAASLRPRGATTFAWTHRYGPLRWPRDGREVLRIRARTPAYWKAASLDVFDGLRWRVPRLREQGEPDTTLAPGRGEWHQTIRVVVRRLRSVEYVGAGTTINILDSPRDAIRSSGGTFVTGGRPLTPGDGYRAHVYTARPTAAEMRRDRGQYPAFVYGHLLMLLPPEVGGPPRAAGANGITTAMVQFPAWGERAPVRTVYPGRWYAVADGAEVLGASRYARMYALAQRLRRQATSPYDLVRRVQQRVRQGATYTERPPAHEVALDAFLFSDRRGYCQQFSGAMALLLRMAGVPARVASGFAPGAYERPRNEYVVRDLDAHSWVEVYFPRYGWVSFDPTPAIAPPRSQALDEGEGALVPGDRPDAGVGGAAAQSEDLVPSDGAVPVWPFALAAVVLGLCAAAAAELRRRGRPPEPAPADLAELMRALHRTRRTPDAPVTLRSLERLLPDDAAAYVRALRERRYAQRGTGPTAAHRRALRRALAEGLGLAGRMRAWWALPPRLRPGGLYAVRTLERDG